MGVLFRIRDLAIKALVRRQWAALRASSPRLAVVPHEHVGLAVLTNGLYEREELDCLSALVRQHALSGGTCLDIGANIGNHAVIWSRIFENVICFEPNPYMGAVLRANLTLNNCTNVRVVDAGLGSEDAQLPFSFHEDGNDGTGTFAIGAGERTLPVRHGDLIVQELGIPPGAVSFVKCDVEGFEHIVFQGLRNMIERDKPVIAFESNSAQLGAQSWSVLRELGYDRLYALRHTAQEAAPLMRELTRLAKGHRCWIEPIDAPPAHTANLIAAATPLI